MEALDIVEINEIMTPGEINEIMTPGIRVGHHNAHRVLPPGKRLALDNYIPPQTRVPKLSAQDVALRPVRRPPPILGEELATLGQARKA